MKFLSIGITVVTMMMPLLVSNVAMACYQHSIGIEDPEIEMAVWLDCMFAMALNTQTKEDTETKEVEEKEYEEVFVSELLEEIEKHGAYVCRPGFEAGCFPNPSCPLDDFECRGFAYILDEGFVAENITVVANSKSKDDGLAEMVVRVVIVSDKVAAQLEGDDGVGDL